LVVKGFTDWEQCDLIWSTTCARTGFGHPSLDARDAFGHRDGGVIVQMCRLGQVCIHAL
jgi:hypothetical protein